MFRLKQLKPDPYGVNSERSLLLDAYNSVKPDVVVFDKSGIDVAPLGATPASIVKLVVEVVSPGSRSGTGQQALPVCRGGHPVLLAGGAR
ncbi:hypothetical protein SRIMM317S_07330 [Streptomyces rimosus subsp. rimosus]